MTEKFVFVDPFLPPGWRSKKESWEMNADGSIIRSRKTKKECTIMEKQGEFYAQLGKKKLPVARLVYFANRRGETIHDDSLEIIHSDGNKKNNAFENLRAFIRDKPPLTATEEILPKKKEKRKRAPITDEQKAERKAKRLKKKRDQLTKELLQDTAQWSDGEEGQLKRKMYRELLTSSEPV